VNTYAVVVIFSVLVYLAVGLFAGRKVKHLDDYYVAGRNAPTLLIVGTLVASVVTTNSFLGETGFAYTGYGVLVAIQNPIACIGYVAGALFFGRFLRRSRALTVAEYFGKRFNSRRVQVAAGTTLILGLGGYLMAVTQGATLLLSEVFGTPYGPTLCAVWVSYTLFTFSSGSKGVIITDTIMFFLFSVVAFVALAYIVDASGGWYTTLAELARFAEKPDVIAWHGPVGDGKLWATPGEALTWAVIMGFAWGILFAVSPWQASRYLIARNEHTVMRSACITVAVLLALWTVLYFAGAAINLSNPNIVETEKAMLWAALNLMPTIVGALLLAGIAAAALSSASTFLSLIGFSAVNDIVRHEKSDDEMLSITRVAMVVIGLVTLVMAYFIPPRILWITYFVAGVYASSWGPVAFMSVWSRRITAAAAFWGMVVGFASNVLVGLVKQLEIVSLPVYLHPIVVGAVLSLLTILVVSRFSSVSEEELAYRKDMHQTPPDECNEKEYRSSLRWAKWLMAGSVVAGTIVAVFYSIPYQLAKNAGTPWRFLAGENLVALEYVASFLIAGGLAYWGIRKSYKPASNQQSFAPIEARRNQR
jgi:sodium/pantothenate symporter